MPAAKGGWNTERGIRHRAMATCATGEEKDGIRDQQEATEGKGGLGDHAVLNCGAEEEGDAHDQPKWYKKCGKLVKSHEHLQRKATEGKGGLRHRAVLNCDAKRKKISATNRSGVSECGKPVKSLKHFNPRKDHRRKAMVEISWGAEMRIETSLQRPEITGVLREIIARPWKSHARCCRHKGSPLCFVEAVKVALNNQGRKCEESCTSVWRLDRAAKRNCQLQMIGAAQEIMETNQELEILQELRIEELRDAAK
ncbi:uncharacterized protein BJ212DRAFT_1302136 [Suillus subaureus]|uniref:Uncharacterized protein n=1 Tax=Suillus subaureus TaxID=48587 RepID=A0A9P7JAA0_9AGAM|nr:uncharacterized protein BJ212DRAFT_1302136 [Suillus subaureus]KAG1811261.1 hypothetical protein BJ212DRAFT_1302136 [Suillus subaureus]